MPIRVCESLAKAQTVLDYIDADESSDTLKMRWLIGAYQNRREQGYTISSYVGGEERCCYVAQHRSSDDIVVYVGVKAGQGLCEDVENTIFCANEKSAARAILKQLKNWEEEV